MMHPFQPFSQLSRIHDEMLRQFEGREGRKEVEAGKTIGKTTAANWAPPVDVIDDGEKLVFEIDLPGVSKESVSIKVEKRVLTVEGERKLELQPKHEFVRMERAHGPFLRSFRLPESVDADAISAELTSGVLRISLSQKREALPRTVEIK